MKFTHSSRGLLLAAAVITPSLVFAQSTVEGSSLTTIFSFILQILNDYVVPVIFAIAFIVFLIGVFRYFIQNGGNPEKVGEGRSFLLWSIIGFVVMFSIWGLVNLAGNIIPGLLSASQPTIPTFNNTSANDNGQGDNSIGSDISNFFGGSGSSAEPGSTLSQPGLFGCGSEVQTPYGCMPPSSSYTGANGVTYTTSPTGALTTTQANGGAGNTGSNTANGGAGNTGSNTANGTVPPGGSCSSDTNCEDINGISYGCYQGTCTVDGDAPADGTVPPGGACTNDNSCEDVGGQSYGCANGICTADGDLNTQDGTVPPGGQCTSDNNCEDVGGQSYGCYQGVCTADGDANSSGGTTCTYGSVPAGDTCVQCSDGFSTADNAADCPGGTNNVVTSCDDGSAGPCVTCDDGNSVGSASECNSYQGTSYGGPW